MGIIIPVAKVSQAEYVEKLKSLKAEALKLGKQLIDAKELVIRPLRPRDLGVSADEWTFNVSSGENTLVNKELDDKTLVLIYGIYNLSTDPQVNEVKFGTAAKTVEDVYIEEMYMYDNPEVMLDEPVVFQPGSSPLIKGVAKGANTAEKLGFKGFVVEPAGRRIGSS